MKQVFIDSMRLSNWIYERSMPAGWTVGKFKQKLRELGFGNVKWIENKKTDTQCAVCSKGKYVYIVFRGSSTGADWQTNFDIELVPCKFGQVHSGFRDDVRSVYFAIVNELPRHIIKGRKLIITGHSQGAGDAICMAIEMLIDRREVEAVVTFGGPRVTDPDAAAYLDRINIVHRFVNNNDLVTRIAPRVFGYKHCGNLHYFRGDGTYTDEILEWDRFLDRLRYKTDFGDEFHLDILNDHMPERYLDLIEQAFA